MIPKGCHSSKGPLWRNAFIVGIVTLLAAGIVSLMPTDTPVAVASRLFQSPVQEPPSPTPEPPPPTATEVVPPPATDTPVPVIPTEPSQPTPLPPSPEPAKQEQPQVIEPRSPVSSPTMPAVVEAGPQPVGTRLDWARLIDTTVLIFSWFWLVCGVVVVIAVTVVMVVLYVRSRRRSIP